MSRNSYLSGREIQLTSDGMQNFQPAWSRDNQYIAYHSKNRGGIWLIPALGGVANQLSEFGSAPAWSRDGSMIAFQSDESPDLGSLPTDSSTIWIVVAHAGTPKQVTEVGNPPGGHFHPAWSPDGRRIAFVTSHSRLTYVWSVSVAGDDLKQMTPNRGYYADPVFSPDGQSLYFTSLRAASLMRVRVSPVSGEALGEPVTVVDIGVGRIRHLSLSGNGGKLAYSLWTATSNVWSIPVSPITGNAKGPPGSLTNQKDTSNSCPVFSPDGRTIAYSEGRKGLSVDVWIMDADGKNPVQVTSESDNEFNLDWFPDGNRIAFISARGGHRSVWSTLLSSGKYEVLADIGTDINWARLSPDGKQIALYFPTGENFNIWAMPVQGGQPKQLTYDQEFAGTPCWSPDGKFIAFETMRGDNTQIMFMPSSGGTPTQLTFDQGQSWPNGWSPDGDKIVFAGLRNGFWNVWWVSLSTKEEKQLTSNSKLNAYVLTPTWSPLGNQIAYEFAETAGNIYVMELKR